jgi:hypothetical protein
MNSSTNRFRHASGHTEMGHKKRPSIAAVSGIASFAVLMGFMLTAHGAGREDHLGANAGNRCGWLGRLESEQH